MSDSEDSERLAQAIDTFSVLQRAMLKRLLPLQAFVAVLQIAVLVAVIYFMRTLQNIETKQITVQEQTEQLVDRPVIRVEAGDGNDKDPHLVIEDPQASTSVQLPLPPASKKK